VDPVIERWQQDGLVALAKPAGLPVFAPHADPNGDCLLKRWRAEQDTPAVVDWPAGFDGGIAHRLDIPTSGQVLAARTVPDLVALRELFSSGALTKRYRLITARDVSWDSHIVQSRIAHDKRRKGRMIVERGRSTPHRGRWYAAHTELHRLGAVEGGWLWEAVIRTGVMHQIRVHAASVGLPLLGDRRYGGGAGLDGQPVDFFLHHIGLIGPGLTPPEDPLPDFWPLTR
jgi:23S rRNA pseudouridine1911/1915/1917 synthase